VRGSETASRVGEQVHHAGQGQDERAHPPAPHLLRGLDSVWSLVSNPHRESGTRCRAAADVGAPRGAAHGRQRDHGGNRLGDSVGAEACGTGKGPRSAAPAQESRMDKSGMDSDRGLVERMGLPGRFKGRGVIGLLGLPDGIENARLDIGQRPDRDGMALALGLLALVILPGPGFLVRTLPGKLVQGIAPGLDAPQSAMRFLVRPALEEDGRSPSQSLPTGALNLLVVGSNLLEQRVQLGDQGQHQPRFGARGDLGGLQLGLLQLHDELLGFLPRSRVAGLLEQRRQLVHRGRASRLQRRIGPQERQRRGLLQLTEHLQGHRVIGFEASRELVDQARLHLDQGILVARQGLEFLDLLAVGIEPAQILEVRTPGFGQQIGVKRVGLGSRGGSSLLHCARINRVHRPSLFQQMSNQEPMGGFHDTSDLLFSLWPGDPLQVCIQLTQPFGRMGDTDRSQWLALFINAQRIMMVVCPIDAAKLHGIAPFLKKTRVPNSCVLILWRSKRDSLMTSRVEEPCRGRASFLNRSSRVEAQAFPWRVQPFSEQVYRLLRPYVERACS